MDLISTSIKADDLTMVYGENKKIVATLVDENNICLKNSELIFKIDGEDYYVTTNNDGRASIIINNDYFPGTYKINIHFLGDQKYDDVRKDITLTIKPSQTTIQKKNVNIEINDINLKKNLQNININKIKGEHFKFCLKSVDGKPLSDTKVIIKINSKKYHKTLNKKGVYTTKMKLKPAKVTVEFKGNDYYNKIKKSAYIYQKINKIKNLKTKFKHDDKVTLKLENVKKKKLKVNFKVSKKRDVITFKKGKAIFKVSKYKLKVGKTYKISFSTDDKLYRLDLNCKLKIIE